VDAVWRSEKIQQDLFLAYSAFIPQRALRASEHAGLLSRRPAEAGLEFRRVLIFRQPDKNPADAWRRCHTLRMSVTTPENG
jgi:hypothetical protein